MSYCGVSIFSVNLSGLTTQVTFFPQTGGTIDLGNQVFPFSYISDYVYGTYSCYVPTYAYTYTVIVSEPTPTVTPSSTPIITPTENLTPTITPTYTSTPTQTPTPSVTTGLTPTPTETVNQTPTPTQTPTITPTNTLTPTITPSPTQVLFAYLFIEPFSGSTSIGQWMFDNNRNFFGFTNSSQPTQQQTEFNIDMNTYVDFSGWTNGEFPSLIQQTVPQTNGGVDQFNNSIVAYNFLTTKIPSNYVEGFCWYTWIIPISLTNYERQVLIDINTNNNANLLTQVGTEPTINSFTFTYTGNTIPTMTYRVYTTYPNNIFRINNTQNIYMRGNTIAP